ncbi:hypothetical protein AB0H77_03790 [Streptomyces sp. NPDC050844]|uniref:hypothetical protein n=1 Tax=Streptomyces sp. NPDC050844 TaxID=3155790 RepID=UPI0033EDE4D3
MSSDTSREAMAPVESEPGVLAHSSADRQLATEQWLLSTLDEENRNRARTEWAERGMALLPLGTLFSAVRIPGRMVLALADTTTPADADDFLDSSLFGGPVICDPRGRRYYALVPGSMPRTWSSTANAWRALGVDLLGRDTVLGVPQVSADEFEPGTPHASYWSVAMYSPGMLCEPLAVARLILAGAHQLEAEADA